MRLKRNGAIFALCGKPLKLVDLFVHLGSNIYSIENDINTCLEEVWIAVDWILIIWKSDLSDEKKILSSCSRVSTTQ